MDTLHLEPGQPESGPDPVYIARQLAGILADHHELQARTYRLMQLSLTTSARAITAAVTPPPLPETGQLAERVQQLVETLDALPTTADLSRSAAAAHAAFSAPPLPAVTAGATFTAKAPPQVPVEPAPTPAPVDPAPAPAPADLPPTPPAQVVAVKVDPIAPKPAPELLPPAGATPPITPATTQDRVYAEWATTLDGPAVISRRLDMLNASVTARLSMGRSRKDPRVLAGDAARRAAGQKLKVKAPADHAPPPPPEPAPAPVDAAAARRDRVLDSYAAEPSKLVVLSGRLDVPVPDLSGILANARMLRDPRVLDGDAKMREANEAARRPAEPPPAPAAPAQSAGPTPVQIRALAQLRTKVLDHYANTGDHPQVVARKLGTTLAQVEDFIDDAGKGDERVKLGNIRRAKQLRAGK